MGVLLESILIRACSRSMNRFTTWSMVVGADAASGCCTGAACAAAGGVVSAACWDGCVDCASLVLLGCAGGCESAACWPAALIEANRVAVNIAFQVHMTLFSISGQTWRLKNTRGSESGKRVKGP